MNGGASGKTMTTVLPLYEGAKPCVRSGMCCNKSPCGYGESRDDSPACRFLQKDENEQYECGKFDEIVRDGNRWHMSPAFGAGCCMPLFNEEREEILKKFRKTHNDVL